MRPRRSAREDREMEIEERCRQVRGVKNTRDAMHRCLGGAVNELRSRMKWGQLELARQIGGHGEGGGAMSEPSPEVISRWENYTQSPSPVYRAALARIAAESKYEDLAEMFRAPMIAWRLVGHVNGLAKDGGR